MIHQYFQEIINAISKKPNQVDPDEIDEIVSILVQYKIDPNKFAERIFAIINSGFQYIEAPFGNCEAIVGAIDDGPIFSQALGLNNKKLNIPTWFLAAFPDVHDWYWPKQAVIILTKGSYERYYAESADLLGLPKSSINEKSLNYFMNSSNCIRVSVYRGLIKKYLATDGNKIGLTCEDSLVDEYRVNHAVTIETDIIEKATKYYALMRNDDTVKSDISKILVAIYLAGNAIEATPNIELADYYFFFDSAYNELGAILSFMHETNPNSKTKRLGVESHFCLALSYYISYVLKAKNPKLYTNIIDSVSRALRVNISKKITEMANANVSKRKEQDELDEFLNGEKFSNERKIFKINRSPIEKLLSFIYPATTNELSSYRPRRAHTKIMLEFDGR